MFNNILFLKISLTDLTIFNNIYLNKVNDLSLWKVLS